METARQRGIVGAAMAGGASRRMGRPKEEVPLWDGRPMLAHVLDALRDACERAVVVGGEPSPERLPDLRPGEGPLAGLESLLASGLGRGYLVVACDQPLIPAHLLRRLLDEAGEAPRFFRAEDGTALDPFPGYYPASLLGEVRAALDAGERSVRRFLKGRDAEWLPLPEGDRPLLRSLNTPEDVAEVLRGR